ncbi:replication/maintenance protein RepL [Larkinella rosea]|uniref:Plasmid replication protein RepL domain-containing protein n=1 Tax=Larkinella rosea TaxID=2025312 RepID=A0A3P1BEJ2_9BACT|nr:replication/maintenance protein RepL [Larkinella rosea]RRA99479.1 hypothetical protein EHT25_26395 [Larkinella rosea]
MRAKTKKVIYEKEIINVQSGEVVQTERETQVPKEPDFIKLYLEDLVMLKDIPQWVSGVLYGLLKHMNYQNEIILNSTIKKRVAIELGIVPKTIDNALVTFVKKSILLRLDTGVYKANPFLFGKGEWSNIRKIRLQIEYGQNGKEVVTEVTKVEPGRQLNLVEMLEEIRQSA